MTSGIQREIIKHLPAKELDQAIDEVADGTREVALAVVEFRRQLRDRVAAVNRSEDLKFDALEHGET